MDIKTKIKLKNCIITKEGAFCDIDQENHQKMMEQKIIPTDFTINLENEIPKNKTIDDSKPAEENKSSDGSKPTEADSSNKQGCGCFKTTENSEIANYVAKYRIKIEED